MKTFQRTSISIFKVTTYVGIAILILQTLHSFSYFPFQTRIFSGRFIGFFEHSLYIPCWYLNPSEIMDKYWLQIGEYATRSLQSKALSEQIRPYMIPGGVFGEGSIDVSIRFIGYQAEPDFRLPFSIRNGYGHLGKYENKITVTKILDISSFNPEKARINKITVVAIVLLFGVTVAILNYKSTYANALLQKNGVMSVLIGCIVSGELFWIINLFGLSCG